jgi:hypothetical protein
MATYLQINFDDFGQDFTEWTFDLASGEIVDCQPFQYDYWVGKYVELASIGVADCPRIAKHEAAANEGDWIAVRYAVVQVRVVDWQPYAHKVQP